MAKSRRGNGEGTITQRKDGRWAAGVSLPNGKRKFAYGKTRDEASQKLTALLKTVQDGVPVTSDKQTVESFSKDWLESIKPSVRITTHRRYEGLLRVNVIPSIGNIRLSRLEPSHLQKLYADRLESGLSAQSVVHMHRVLRTMLKRAAQWGTVARNVADLVSPPKVPHREMLTLSADEAKALLSAASGTRLEALWWIALGTGLRSGEILGLRWSAIDLNGKRLHVRHTLQRQGGTYSLEDPKTERSRRTISLSASIMSHLAHHRTQQNVERLAIGAVWNDEDFVFTNQIGAPLKATELPRQEMRPLLKMAGLSERLRFHDLRHTAISLALASNTAPTDVMQMAGHSSVALTLSRYAHAMPGAESRATDAIDAALTGV